MPEGKGRRKSGDENGDEIKKKWGSGVDYQ
jgi:hypothetical protein